jgi:hypothetical protein
VSAPSGLETCSGLLASVGRAGEQPGDGDLIAARASDRSAGSSRSRCRSESASSRRRPAPRPADRAGGGGNGELGQPQVGAVAPVLVGDALHLGYEDCSVRLPGEVNSVRGLADLGRWPCPTILKICEEPFCKPGTSDPAVLFCVRPSLNAAVTCDLKCWIPLSVAHILAWLALG